MAGDSHNQKQYPVALSPRDGMLPPQDLEAERSLLGGLLLDPSSISRVIDIGLAPQDFYREANGKIFEAICELSARSEPVDLVTLSAHLRNKGAFEEIGATPYLTSLFGDAFSSAHVGQYGKIVAEKSTLRRLISASNKIIEESFTGVDQMDDFLDQVEQQLFEVTNAKTRPTVVGIREVLAGNLTRIQMLAEKNSAVTGLPTGFKDFDRITSGLQGGQLIIIAARPAMGKTSLALNIAENAAIHAGAGVAIFSLEMSKEELGFRFLTSLAKVDASDLKIGRLKERDWKVLTAAANKLSECRIFVDDTAALSVLELRSRCRRIQSEHGLELVVVDYLQLMRGSSRPGKGGGDNREREISEISRGLKALAKELRVPVIALSQLNRGVEARTDKRPMLSDLRESGAIEQDADIVTFVYRDEVYNKESEDKGKAEFIIAKHRAGAVGTVRLTWDAAYTAFGNEDAGMVGSPLPAGSFDMPQGGGSFGSPSRQNQGSGGALPHGDLPGPGGSKRPGSGFDLPNF